MPTDALQRPLRSAVYDAAYDKAELAAIEAKRPLDEATLDKIATEAEGRSVYGHDAKKDRNGNFIPQGVGSDANPSLNHFAAIRRYEGEAKYQAAIRKMWKENPEGAKRIGLEQPERLSA